MIIEADTVRSHAKRRGLADIVQRAPQANVAGQGCGKFSRSNSVCTKTSPSGWNSGGCSTPFIGKFRQNLVQQPSFIEQQKSFTRDTFSEHLGQFIANTLTSDLIDTGASFRIAPKVWVDLISEPGGEAHRAHHPQFVFGKTQFGIADSSDDSGPKSFFPPTKSRNSFLTGSNIRPLIVKSRRSTSSRAVAEADLVGMAAIAVADVATEGSDLDRDCSISDRNQDDAKLRAHRIGLGKDPHDLVRGCVGGDVVIGRFAAKQEIADASSDQVGLMLGRAGCG